jgi:hypothetical protein
VRSKLVTALTVVEVDDLLRVDGEELVGVDHDAEEARVGLNRKIK